MLCMYDVKKNMGCLFGFVHNVIFEFFSEAICFILHDIIFRQPVVWLHSVGTFVDCVVYFLNLFFFQT